MNAIGQTAGALADAEINAISAIRTGGRVMIIGIGASSIVARHRIGRHDLHECFAAGRDAAGAGKINRSRIGARLVEIKFQRRLDLLHVGKAAGVARLFPGIVQGNH